MTEFWELKPEIGDDIDAVFWGFRAIEISNGAAFSKRISNGKPVLERRKVKK